jgi:hypothetical protein
MKYQIAGSAICDDPIAALRTAVLAAAGRRTTDE